MTAPIPAEDHASWSRAQRRLHWWTASLVLLAFTVAWLMVAIPLSQLLLKFALYQLHKTAGLTVLLLTLMRFAFRAKQGRPEWDEELRPWQKRAASIVHALLYALLVAAPVLGYFTAALAPARVPTLFLGVLPVPHLLAPDAAWFEVVRSVHRGVAISLMLLACGHAAAAIQHHVYGRSTLARMMWGPRAHPSAQPGSR